MIYYARRTMLSWLEIRIKGAVSGNLRIIWSKLNIPTNTAADTGRGDHWATFNWWKIKRNTQVRNCKLTLKSKVYYSAAAWTLLYRPIR